MPQPVWPAAWDEVYPEAEPTHKVLHLAPRRSPNDIRAILDRFVANSDAEALAKSDPVELVRAYDDPHDLEVAGLLVAGLAYGRVASIKAKASELLGRLGPSPAAAVDEGRAERIANGFVYRFQRDRDLPRFFAALRKVRSRHGSLAALFVRGIESDAEDYGEAMDRFALALRRTARRPHTNGFTFLLPRSGETGGAAKRLCLFLRWMVRPAGPQDVGAWRALVGDEVDPSRLLIPLDTHVHRIARYIGLTDRASSGLKTSREITRNLRALRPLDPLYYDIALCHLGISGRCPRQRDLDKCAGCPIRSLCRLGATPDGW